jgi:hypothetical protein
LAGKTPGRIDISDATMMMAEFRFAGREAGDMGMR